MQGILGNPEWTVPLSRSSAILTLAAVILHTGCGAGWHTTPLAPRSLPARQLAQVWTGGVALGGMLSLSRATPSAACPSTHPRVTAVASVSREAVDSVRLGNPTTGFLKGVGLGLGATFAAAILICKFESECQLGD